MEWPPFRWNIRWSRPAPIFRPICRTRSSTNSIPAHLQPLEENPAYSDPENWTTVGMVDDGTGDDEFAGDDVYTATLPAQDHRTLVRYRITVEDSLGKADRVPYADDDSLNFAYFVYNEVPDYNGSLRLDADESSGISGNHACRGLGYLHCLGLCRSD